MVYNPAQAAGEDLSSAGLYFRRIRFMEKLIFAMIEYDRGDAKRIQHFLKVYELARTIGRLEGLDEDTQYILESAAVVHDIGIHNSEEKYGSCSGKYQELEGPPEAKKLLEGLGWPENVISRVCFLVGHHHTYTGIDGADWQILVEADFLVNLFEDDEPAETVQKACDQIFKTESGRKLCRLMFGLE